MISNDIMTAINDVLACADPLEAMVMYYYHYRLLKECRFILFSNELGTDVFVNPKLYHILIENWAS